MQDEIAKIGKGRETASTETKNLIKSQFGPSSTIFDDVPDHVGKWNDTLMSDNNKALEWFLSEVYEYYSRNVCPELKHEMRMVRTMTRRINFLKIRDSSCRKGLLCCLENSMKAYNLLKDKNCIADNYDVFDIVFDSCWMIGELQN